MIQLFPKPYNKFICPACKSSSNSLEKVVFQGIHLLADLRCKQCGLLYYHDFPTGQAISSPAVINKTSLTLFSQTGSNWFTSPLLNSLHSPIDRDIHIEKKINNQILSTDTIIFFNCLDAWYGHVLLKLFNIHFYHKKYPSFKKIVLLPRGFAWMTPHYADELWIADVSLSETKNYYLKLEDYILSGLKQYATVYHSAGYSHPELQEIHVQDFFKVQPFNLEQFNSQPYRITFIYREDRLWISPLFSKICSYLRYKKMNTGSSLFIRWQLRKINALYKEIQKTGTPIEFYVCGLGKTGKFHKNISDKRSLSVSTDQEQEWCRIYSKSHVIIGIHGSNMLIPSALAATWVEVLPDDRLSNITQDLFCKYAHSNMSYLGRFTSEYDPVKRVAGTIVNLLTNYTSFLAQKPHSYEI